MNREEVKDRFLKAYSVYYNVSTFGIREPFFAEAEFHETNRQYFLVRSARLAEHDSNEYAYFAETDLLTAEDVAPMCDEAWRRGLFMCKPHSGHKNTDVLLFIIADSITDEARKLVTSVKKYQSYKYTFWGWSKFRLVAIDLSGQKVFFNREGRLLEKVVSNVIKF